MKQNIFISFGKFSEFRKHLDKTQPVNIQSIIEGERGNVPGFVYQKAVIICGQLQIQTGEVFCHYWPTAEWQESGGEPLGERHDNRCDSAYQLTLSLLSDFTIRPAVILIPKDIKPLIGSNDLLVYQKDTDIFSLAAQIKYPEPEDL